MNTRTRISTMLATTVAAAMLSTAPATADVALHAPDTCGPASSTAQDDVVDRITFRKEQMSLARAAGASH